MSSRRITVPLALLAACLSVTCAAGELLVDPTRPFTASTSTSTPVFHHAGQLKVEAIFDRDGRRVAIVGGQVVHSGEHCAWGDIDAITLTGIRYTHDGKVLFVELDNPKLQVRRTSRETVP
jgi:hypothetical protein